MPDPDAMLAEMLRLARAMRDHTSDDIDDVDRLAGLVIALDEWIQDGQALPAAWQEV